MNNVNLAFGYLFLLTGGIGCIAVIALLFNFNIFYSAVFWSVFLPTEGKETTVPLFLAGISVAGAYLVKNRP